MNALINALKGLDDYKLTENGALSYRTTGNPLVDLFGVIGALRTRPPRDVAALFANAFAEDKLLATKMSFYARNVRGGLGERDVPRIIWRYLAENHPDVVLKNMEFIPLFGRWDDILIFDGTPVESAMFELIGRQLRHDTEQANQGKPVSLAAKWIPRTDIRNAEKARLGRKIARRLGISNAAYNKSLSNLREYLGVVERKMGQNRWAEIVYSAVPSRAMMRYRHLFLRHDEERFKAYLESLEQGKTKINSATLFPYDIFERMGLTMGYRRDGRLTDEYFYFSHPDGVLEQQWKALPNYVGEGANVLIMADTSASMMSCGSPRGRALSMALSLAVYFAERNKGAFKDTFMTFSSRPSLVQLRGSTLAEKVACIPSIVENTDLHLAFELLLKVAVENRVPAEDMPKSIVVISDMEIDRGASGYETFHSVMRRHFEEKGYDLPNVVYWNVDARNDTFHARADVPGVQFFSGGSPSVFKAVMATVGKTPYEAMIATLSDPMYDCITV